MKDFEHIASQLYTEYCAKVGGKAFNGDPLPAWEQFAADPAKQKQVEAWRAVAKLAVTIVCDAVA